MPSPLQAGSKRRHAFAVVSMLGGSCGVFLTVWAMNSAKPEKIEEPREDVTAFKVEKREPPKKKKRKEKPKKQRSMKSTASAPTPNLSSAISGANIGLPEFEVAQVGEVSNELLGDTDKKLVMADGSWDVPPKIQRRVQAEYPEKQQKRGVEGYVKLSVFVDEDGRVDRLKVLDANPRGVFESAAKAAVEQWEFSPGQYEGQAVSGWVTQMVRFKLTKS